MNHTTIEPLIANVGDMALKRRLKTIIGRLDLSSPGAILDLGCGDGMYLMVISHLGKRGLVGYDIDFGSLQLARRVIAPLSKTRLINGAANVLPYKDMSFDVVYASEVLEHLRDDRGALSEIRRVLKPDGRLLVTVPNARYPFFWDPVNWLFEHIFGFHIRSGFFAGLWNMHLRLYRPEDLSLLIQQAGFEIRDIRALTHYCVPFSHYIINGLRRVLDMGILPKTIQSGGNKFAVKECGKKGIVHKVYAFLDRLDRANDNVPAGCSSVSIFVEAVKR